MSMQILCHIINEQEVSCNGTVYKEVEVQLSYHDAYFWIYLSAYVLLMLLAGIMSGQTLGLLSLDLNQLEILMVAGKPKYKKYATRIYPIVKKHHFLLVTLLLANAVCVESMPIFMDKITSPIIAIAISVTAVLLFGEIIPLSLCTRYGLAIGYYLLPLVRILMCLFFIIAWPIAKLLDCVLGTGHTTFFRRAELKVLVEIHRNNHDENEEPLSREEALIIQGALDLSNKKAKDATVPLEAVFMLHSEALLDFQTMTDIIDFGHSRVPVYKTDRSDIIGLLLVKALIPLDPQECIPIVDVMRGREFIPRFSEEEPLYNILKACQTGRMFIDMKRGTIVELHKEVKKTKENETYLEKITNIKRSLSEDENQVAALKQFITLAEEDLDFVETYLQTSSECKELFALFQAERNYDLLSFLWQAFEVVFKHTSYCETKFRSSGVFAATKILQNNMKSLYSSLNVNSSHSLSVSALKCMAVMLAQGNHIVKEFATYFDFTLKGLKFLATKRVKKMKTDPRKAFVRFILAFYVFGDTPALLKMLEDKGTDHLKMFTVGLVSLVFAELHKDSTDVIIVVLETLFRNVVEDSNVMKKTKLLIFNQMVLTKLTHLCKHADNTISELALKMLKILCTHPKKGVCFVEKKDVPTNHKVMNPILLKFLSSIKQQASCTPSIFELTMQTLQTCPDAVQSYLTSVDLKMEPRPVEAWFSKMRFAIKANLNTFEATMLIDFEPGQHEMSMKDPLIKIKLPTFFHCKKLSQVFQHTHLLPINISSKEELLSEMRWRYLQLFSKVFEQITPVSLLLDDSRSLSTVDDSIIKLLLPEMTKRHFEMGVKSSSILVSLATMKMLKVALNRCVDFKEHLVKMNVESLTEWTDTILQCLPDVATVVAVRQVCGVEKVGAVSEMKTDDKHVTTTEDCHEILCSTISCLRLYQTIKPGVLSQSGYNICKLLIFPNEVNDSKIVDESLEILLHEPNGVRYWLEKKLPNHKGLLHLLMKLSQTWRNNADIIHKCRSLFYMVLNATGLYASFEFEIDTWLHCVIERDNTTICNLFASACMESLNNPFACVRGAAEVEKPTRSILLHYILSICKKNTEMMDEVVCPVLNTILVCSSSPQIFLASLNDIVDETINKFTAFSNQWMNSLREGNKLKVELIPNTNILERIATKVMCEKYDALEELNSDFAFLSSKFHMMPRSSLKHMLNFYNSVIKLVHNRKGDLDFFADNLRRCFKDLLVVSSKFSGSINEFQEFWENCWMLSKPKSMLWSKTLLTDLFSSTLDFHQEFSTFSFVAEFTQNLQTTILSVKSKEKSQKGMFLLLRSFIGYLPPKVVSKTIEGFVSGIFASSDCTPLLMEEVKSLFQYVDKYSLHSEDLSLKIDSGSFQRFLRHSIKTKNESNASLILLVLNHSVFRDYEYNDLCELLQTESVQFGEIAMVMCGFSKHWVHSLLADLLDEDLTNKLPWMICLVSRAVYMITDEQFEELGKRLISQYWELLLRSLSNNSASPLIQQLLPFLSTQHQVSLCKALLHDEISHTESSLVLLETVVCNVTKCADFHQLVIEFVSFVMQRIIKATNHACICVEILNRAISSFEKIQIKWSPKYFKLVSHAWNPFVKYVLKNKFMDSAHVDLLSMAVSFLYRGDDLSMKGMFLVKDIYSMLVNHSKFLKVVLDVKEEKEDIKCAILNNLQTLVRLSPSLCELSMVQMLLVAYSARLTVSDQFIYSLLGFYERNGVSLSALRPLCWGERRDSKKATNSLEDRSFTRVLEIVDSNMLVQTAVEFPIHLQLNSATFPSSRLYDPRFMLTTLVSALQPGCYIDCRQIIESGFLSLTFASLSSRDIEMRRLGYLVLSLFDEHLEGSRFREKSQVTYLFMLLKNSISESSLCFTTVWALLLVRYMHFVLRPGLHLYLVLNNSLLLKPTINVKEMPFFLPLFNSSGLEHKQERQWLLQLLSQALKDVTDFYLYKKYHVFELVLAYHDSTACDHNDKDTILKLISNACAIETAAYDLVKTHGLVAWTHANIKRSQHVSSYYILLSTLARTFHSSNMPRLFPNEAVMTTLAALPTIETLPPNVQLDILYVMTKNISTSSYFGDVIAWIHPTQLSLVYFNAERLLLTLPNTKDYNSDIDTIYSDALKIAASKKILNTAQRPWGHIKSTIERKRLPLTKSFFIVKRPGGIFDTEFLMRYFNW